MDPREQIFVDEMLLIVLPILALVFIVAYFLKWNRDQKRFLELTAIVDPIYKGKHRGYFLGVSRNPENGRFFAEGIDENNNREEARGLTKRGAIVKLEQKIDIRIEKNSF